MDRLQANQELKVNEELVSNNGWFRLGMFGDGNLVIYRTQARLTITVLNRFGQLGGHAVMQGDGNFVAYSPNGTPYWDTGTWGHPGAWVVMQDDGNLVVYDNANNPLWASNTV